MEASIGLQVSIHSSPSPKIGNHAEMVDCPRAPENTSHEVATMYKKIFMCPSNNIFAKAEPDSYGSEDAIK
jgi:hypothetical protein